MGPLTVRRAERYPLWDLIHMLLASIDDIFWAVDRGRPNDARMLRHRYRDLMRLLDDIGWVREDERAEYAITMEPAALMRVLARLHEQAIELVYEHADGGGLELFKLEFATIGGSACGTLLVQLAHTHWPVPDEAD
jgi:hypothetical protein